MNIIPYLMLFLGCPYKYGGDNPVSGFDCSGLVTEGLRATGKLKWNERCSSQMLYDKCLNEWNAFTVRRPTKGDVLFFGSSTSKVSHVAMMISDDQLIEAGGGNSSTDTVDEAAARDAFVRLRPWKYRRDLLTVVRIPGVY